MDYRPACNGRAAVSFFYFSHGLVRVCEMGKNNGNPDLVCENETIAHSQFKLNPEKCS